MLAQDSQTSQQALTAGFLARGHDEEVLLDLLASGALAGVQLADGDPERDDERASPAFVDAPLRRYRLVRQRQRRILRPPMRDERCRFMTRLLRQGSLIDIRSPLRRLARRGLESR